VLYFSPRGVAMAPLDFLLATILLMASACWGVRGVLPLPGMMVLVWFTPLAASWERFFICLNVKALRHSPQKCGRLGSLRQFF